MGEGTGPLACWILVLREAEAPDPNWGGADLTWIVGGGWGERGGKRPWRPEGAVLVSAGGGGRWS